jgi:hypothetical protein
MMKLALKFFAPAICTCGKNMLLCFFFFETATLFHGDFFIGMGLASNVTQGVGQFRSLVFFRTSSNCPLAATTFLSSKTVPSGKGTPGPPL